MCGGRPSWTAPRRPRASASPARRRRPRPSSAWRRGAIDEDLDAPCMGHLRRVQGARDRPPCAPARSAPARRRPIAFPAPTIQEVVHGLHAHIRVDEGFHSSADWFASAPAHPLSASSRSTGRAAPSPVACSRICPPADGHTPPRGHAFPSARRMDARHPDRGVRICRRLRRPDGERGRLRGPARHDWPVLAAGRAALWRFQIRASLTLDSNVRLADSSARAPV